MLISIILTGVIIPKIILIAFRKNYSMKSMSARYTGDCTASWRHRFPPSIIFSFCVVIGFNLRTEELSLGEPLMMEMIPIFFLLCGLMLMYLVGIADDLIGVRYRASSCFRFSPAHCSWREGCGFRTSTAFSGSTIARTGWDGYSPYSL